MESNSAVLDCPETDDKIKVSFREITPKNAIALLGINHKSNRLIKESYVNSYVKQMKSGDWHPSSCEAIKISGGQNPILIDGQHRLHAVIKANTPVTFLIIEGIPECSFTAIDDGAPRDLAAALKINGVSVKGGTQRIASTLRILMQIESHLLSNNNLHSARLRTSITEGVQFHAKLPNFNEVTHKFCNLYAHPKIGENFNPPTLIALYYMFNGIDEATDEAVHTICLGLETGTPFDDFKNESPTYHIIRYIKMLRDKNVIVRAATYMELFIWALDKTLQNEPVQALGDFSDAFNTRIDCVRLANERFLNRLIEKK